MATTTASKGSAGTKPAAKQRGTKAASTTKRGAPADVIASAAKDLERDVAKAVRAELTHLRGTLRTLEKDVKRAITRVERALDGPASKKAPAKKASAKKASAKKAPAKKAPAEKAPARKR